MKTNKQLKIESRDKLFLEIIDLIPTGRGAMSLLAFEAGVNYQTLWNWVYGETMAPRISTLIKVAEALGYSIELKRVRRRKLRAVS